MLENNDLVVRKRTVDALRYKLACHPDVILALVAILKVHDENDLYLDAAEILGHQSDPFPPEILADLKAMLEDNAHLNIRKAAIKALSRQFDLHLDMLTILRAMLERGNDDDIAFKILSCQQLLPPLL